MMERKHALLALMFVAGTASAQMQPVQMTSASAASSQVHDELLAGSERFANGARDVSEVNMDAKMLAMVGKDNEMARKMDFVVVRSYKYDKPGMYQASDFDMIRKRLEDGTWSCFVHTRDRTGSTDICMRGSNDKETNEMIVMTAQDKEVTFVHLKGRLPLDQMGKMGNVPTPPAPPAPPLQKR